MIHYSNEQLATIVALPTITTLLVWTIAIFHKNRKRWGPYDIPIVSVLVLSVIRNITILVYVLVTTLGDQINFNVEYCSIIVWIFNSLHTFQASSLTTIAVIGLFSVKLHQKQQNLKMFLTPTHIIYHLFCLTTLCACVGVAAILAQTESEMVFQRLSSVFEISPCRFMPFNLDIKFNVFILVLHLFLAVISFSSFVIICYNFYKMKRNNFQYIKKSNSDLSDMSMGMANTLNGDNNKGFYDTYTVHRPVHNPHASDHHPAYYDNQHHPQHGFRDINWNSDLSNLSATVSSTNSRKPCLGKTHAECLDEETRTGLETMHPVLIVCYLFYHLPLIILCIYPKLIHPWPVVGIALWLGLVQDLLIPIGLGIVDSRFCKWVSNVYRCSGKSVEEKLPHVGLDGKFRPFGTASQPQSLEIPNTDRQMKLQTVEHRFPITNGSLYTSIDGRLPVIHNYRRNKENRTNKPLEKQSSNVALHSTHLNRKEYPNNTQKIPSCSNCETDLCPSHSNLHHLSPQYINKQLNLLQSNPNRLQYASNLLQPSSSFLQQNLLMLKKPFSDRVSYSQESLNHVPEKQKHFFYRNSDLGLNAGINNHIMKNSRNLLRLNKMRLSRSEDSLDDLQVRDLRNIVRQPIQNTPSPQQSAPPQQKQYKSFTKVEVNVQNNYSSSDDDYLTDINETMNNNDNFDSMSSRSCYSITTEANGDFEFFQNNDRISSNITLSDTQKEPPNKNEVFVINNINNRPVMTSFKTVTNNLQTDVSKNFRITRSNSKRSLENFQAFVEVEQVDLQNGKSTLQRSNSYMLIEEKLRERSTKKLIRSDSNLSDCSHKFNNFRPKIKSVEYLPNSNTSTIFIEDLNGYDQYNKRRNCYNDNKKSVGSVPDLKKVFISEYI